MAFAEKKSFGFTITTDTRAALPHMNDLFLFLCYPALQNFPPAPRVPPNSRAPVTPLLIFFQTPLTEILFSNLKKAVYLQSYDGLIAK